MTTSVSAKHREPLCYPPFPRSHSTVDGEVKCSHAVQLSALVTTVRAGDDREQAVGRGWPQLTTLGEVLIARLDAEANAAPTTAEMLVSSPQ